MSEKHKHSMMNAFWSSLDLDIDVKKSLWKKLDQSNKDWVDNTWAYCEAAHKENKSMMWEKYFSKAEDAEINDWGLHHFQHSFAGFNQAYHKDLTAPFVDDFFKNIENIFVRKGRFVAEAYFMYLRPMNDTSDAAIAKYDKLLEQVRVNNPDNTQLIDLIRDTIADLKIMGKAQQLSSEHIAKSAAK